MDSCAVEAAPRDTIVGNLAAIKKQLIAIDDLSRKIDDTLFGFNSRNEADIQEPGCALDDLHIIEVVCGRIIETLEHVSNTIV